MQEIGGKAGAEKTKECRRGGKMGETQPTSATQKYRPTLDVPEKEDAEFNKKIKSTSEQYKTYQLAVA